MNEIVKKIISIIRYIVAIGLIIFGIGIAVYQIQKNYDFLGRIKIWGFYIAVLLISGLFFKFTRDRKKDDATWLISSILSMIFYFVVLTIYTIFKAWGETHNIFMIIFMWFFTMLMQTGPFLLVGLFILGGLDDSPSSSTQYSTQPKSRKIRATTFNWSDNWSTTTYKDEDGNETKIDHWKF